MPEAEGRWRALAVLSTCMLLALTPWFSAAAVSPLIGAEWSIGSLEIAMLTVAVQVGFALGAFVIAFSGAADVMPPNRLIALGALLAAGANAAFALFAVDLVTAVPLRALSGAGIAAVYPVALKVLSGWFGRDRGLAVVPGMVMSRLTFGLTIASRANSRSTTRRSSVSRSYSRKCRSRASLSSAGVRSRRYVRFL